MSTEGSRDPGRTRGCAPRASLEHSATFLEHSAALAKPRFSAPSHPPPDQGREGAVEGEAWRRGKETCKEGARSCGSLGTGQGAVLESGSRGS